MPALIFVRTGSPFLTGLAAGFASLPMPVARGDDAGRGDRPGRGHLPRRSTTTNNFVYRQQETPERC